MGAITGRALYEGTLDLSEGQALADELCKEDEGRRDLFAPHRKFTEIWH